MFYQEICAQIIIYVNLCLSYSAVSGLKALALKVVYGPGKAWQSDVNVAYDLVKFKDSSLIVASRAKLENIAS
jgi:hypothetical protein